MGGFQSSEPDDYETNSSKEKQPGYSPKYQHHTQHPYNQGPQQKQQQLYPQPQDRQQQQQLQQQQHRNISSVSTSELLEYLDREFSTTVDIIRTMRKEKKFDDDGRRYICGVMIEKEHLLRRLNNNTDIITELQQELSIYKRDLEKERAARENMKQQLEEVKTEKAALNMRLSKIAGDRLVRDNPSITDLSDRNRPTKIGEMYSEIYDNEWTDAFEALNNAGYSEQDAIETLRLTLLNVFQFCSKKAESLLKKTEEAVNILFEEYKATEQMKDMRHLTMPRNLSEQWGKLIRRSSFTDDMETIALQDKWKPNIKGYQGLKHDQTILKTDKSEVAVVDQLKKFRKEVAESMVPIVEKAYISASWNDKCIYALKPFIKKCIFLGWMMVVQSPPMTLAECKPGENFQKEAYKEYTQRGVLDLFGNMGALPSSEPDYHETGDLKQRQYGYQVKNYYTSKPYNEHPHNHRPQQQPQHHYPHQQEGQHQQQPRQVSPLSTQELLEYLDNELMSIVDIIRNMKKEKIFDDGGRSYICEVMTENESLLRKFNIDMDPMKRTVIDKEVQRLRETIMDLRDENSRLDAEKKYIDGLLTSSTRQPSTKSSNHDRPTSSGYNESITRGKENKGTQQNCNDIRHQDKIKELQQKLSVSARDLEDERAKAVSYIAHLKHQLGEVETEKKALQMRLSKMAGDRLIRDNPAIADLSDPNRPTKIGEMYSEIYDNEWTDAFEALKESGYQEEDVIETLRLTLMNVFQFCSRKAESLLKKTEEAVNILFEEYKANELKKDMRHLTMPRNLSEQWGKLVRRASFTDDLGTIALQDKWKPKTEGYQGQIYNKTTIKSDISEVKVVDQLRKFRKEVAESMVPVVEKAYMSASWNDKYVHALKPFIRKCILLGWMMVVQSPPMTLAECRTGEKLKKEAYKEYTKSGSVIDYVVWPALLLNQGGPVVGKGVAQAKKT